MKPNAFSAMASINGADSQGLGEEAERLRQFGLNPDGSTAGEDVMS